MYFRRTCVLIGRASGGFPLALSVEFLQDFLFHCRVPKVPSRTSVKVYSKHPPAVASSNPPGVPLGNPPGAPSWNPPRLLVRIPPGTSFFLEEFLLGMLQGFLIRVPGEIPVHLL